jgi:hypothetical protein
MPTASKKLDGPVFEGRRYTGFHDRYGTPICEGDLVITRERHWWFRQVAIKMGYRYRWWNNLRWGRYGRWKGRVWLGVVVESDDGVNPKCWVFQSVNMSVTIHEYWQEDLQIVAVPQGCTLTWKYQHWRDWEDRNELY